MLNFVPDKEHLLLLFNWKKSTAEAHRILAEAYGDNDLSKTRCRTWFRAIERRYFKRHRIARFIGRSRHPIVETTCRAVVSASRQAISKRLQAMGMSQKIWKWVPASIERPTNGTTFETW